jgi:hypothetical protein
VLLVEPAYTRSGFDAKGFQPDAPLPTYEEQRRAVDRVPASPLEDGDDPAMVARSIVVPHGHSTGRSGSSIACPPEPSTI